MGSAGWDEGLSLHAWHPWTQPCKLLVYLVRTLSVATVPSLSFLTLLSSPFSPLYLWCL